MPRAELPAITQDLGTTWAGAGAQFKLYPCAHVIHPFIEASLTARRDGGIVPAVVGRIVCRIPPWAMPIVAEPRPPKIAPRNDLEAIASLPFMVAAALADGEVTLATLAADHIARADIRQLAARIDCEADPALVAGFDGTMDIVATTGERRHMAAVLPPAGRERVTAKFRANAALGGMTRAAELEDALLDGGIGVGELMAMAVLHTLERSR